MKQGLILFVVQFFLNLIATVNMRATAQGNYLWTGITDFVTAVLGFATIYLIIEGGNWVEKLIGFTVGAVAGSLIGIYLSKKILKK